MYSLEKINSAKALKEQIEKMPARDWKTVLKKVFRNKKHRDSKIYKMSRLGITIDKGCIWYM